MPKEIVKHLTHDEARALFKQVDKSSKSYIETYKKLLGLMGNRKEQPFIMFELGLTEEEMSKNMNKMIEVYPFLEDVLKHLTPPELKVFYDVWKDGIPTFVLDCIKYKEIKKSQDTKEKMANLPVKVEDALNRFTDFVMTKQGMVTIEFFTNSELPFKVIVDNRKTIHSPSKDECRNVVLNHIYSSCFESNIKETFLTVFMEEDDKDYFSVMSFLLCDKGFFCLPEKDYNSRFVLNDPDKALYRRYNMSFSFSEEEYVSINEETNTYTIVYDGDVEKEIFDYSSEVM